MRRTLVTVALTTVAAAGLALAAATPALAFATPPTLSFDQPDYEFANIGVHGECPLTTTSFTLKAMLDGDSTVYNLADTLAFDSSTGLVTGDFAEELAPGTHLMATLTCLDAGNAAVGAVTTGYTTTDTGATLTATSAGLDAPIHVEGDCGAVTGTTDIAFRFTVDGNDPAEYPHETFTTSPWSYDLDLTPADLGASEGSTVEVVSICIIVDGDLQTLQSARTSSFTVTTPAPAPALAATGTDATTPLAAGLLLLLAGGALLVLRRRSVSR